MLKNWTQDIDLSHNVMFII